MTKSLFIKIVKNLSEEPYFLDYKFVKKDCCFVKKSSIGCDRIELQNWESFDRDDLAIVIVPQYSKRFNILHKWFERFSFKSIADQRFGSSISFNGNMLNKKNSFFFLSSGVDFGSDMLEFKSQLIENSKHVSMKYFELLDLYNYLIAPVIKGSKELPNIGADWIFEYLTLTRLVKPEQYQVLKSLVVNNIKLMNSRGEPNIIEYYSRLDEIFNYLESLELTN